MIDFHLTRLVISFLPPKLERLHYHDLESPYNFPNGSRAKCYQFWAHSRSLKETLGFMVITIFVFSKRFIPPLFHINPFEYLLAPYTK